jgi:hypothetical protein
MYNVKVNENYFYQGAYAKVGKIQNGEDMPCLPPEENQLCYYIDFKEKIEIEQVVVKTYTKNVTSETEFDTYYEVKTEDEEGNEFSNSITEEEYNALTDEEKENVTITQYPVIVQVELTKEEYEALSDEEKMEIYVFDKTDEEGNLVYEDVEKTIIVKEWAFSQEKYNELEAQRLVNEQAAAEQKAEEQYVKEMPDNVRQQRADIDYIALMSGVMLEDYPIMPTDDYSYKYHDIKKYYDNNLWSAVRVHNMVAKNVITAEECQLITGKEYVAN